jgi:hypothetical protein
MGCQCKHPLAFVHQKQSMVPLPVEEDGYDPMMVRIITDQL